MMNNNHARRRCQARETAVFVGWQRATDGACGYDVFAGAALEFAESLRKKARTDGKAREANRASQAAFPADAARA